MEAYPDEENMESARLNDEIQYHWMMVSKDNKGVADDEKFILPAKRWYVYMNEKLSLMKGGYYV